MMMPHRRAQAFSPAAKGAHFDCYLAASGVSAVLNFPLWKNSAINQSGFVEHAGHGVAARLSAYVDALKPPYLGMPGVVFGMTWARCAIFYGSDTLRPKLEQAGAPSAVAMALPPMLLSTLVQVVNMPIVRASITMQDPRVKHDPRYQTTGSTVRHLARTKGVAKLWHALPAGIAKSVPKYITSVVVKDLCDLHLPPAANDAEFVLRSTVKSVLAGLAGAVLTNPMDVVRNEAFKTDLGMRATVARLCKLDLERPGAKQTLLASCRWMTRGMYSNLLAVSLPISVTIFLTDVFVRLKSAEATSTN